MYEPCMVLDVQTGRSPIDVRSHVAEIVQFVRVYRSHASLHSVSRRVCR